MFRYGHLVALATALVVPSAATFNASAQDFPSKPIRIIVAFAPGGVADTGARAITDKLSARLGQQVSVENRPGASGNIGAQMVAQSPPDGYTLLLAFDGTMVINPHVFPKMPIDTVNDFAYVTKLGDATLILVAHPSVPANNFQELLALSKKKPGTLSFGTSGTASTPHITGEFIKLRTGLDMAHVPYKGGGQALIDVVGGQIPLVFTAIAGANQYVKQGRIRGIAIPSAKRDPALPDVPTFAESGAPGIEAYSWIGIAAPAKTPKPIVDRLQREIAAVLNEPDIRQRYAVLGIIPSGNTPEAYTEQVRADLIKWGAVVKQAGVKME
ncbi:MAG: tripartite tricarboxylate transporter substrate binding protein [Burkholderiales bacterium]